MGRYEKHDNTGAFDACITGIWKTKMTDKKTGKEVEGRGFNKEESENDAWRKLKEDE